MVKRRFCISDMQIMHDSEGIGMAHSEKRSILSQAGWALTVIGHIMEILSDAAVREEDEFLIWQSRQIFLQPAAGNHRTAWQCRVPGKKKVPGGAR